jgi:hypothetical protein
MGCTVNDITAPWDPDRFVTSSLTIKIRDGDMKVSLVQRISSVRG